MELVELKKDGPLREMARDIKERALLFMEEIVENGGYFQAVQDGSSLTPPSILRETATVSQERSKAA